MGKIVSGLHFEVVALGTVAALSYAIADAGLRRPAGRYENGGAGKARPAGHRYPRRALFMPLRRPLSD